MRLHSAAFVLLLTAGIAAAAEPAVPAARTIVLVRHGHYTADASIDEAIGPGLSPIGVAQAHLAGSRLAGDGTRFDAWYVSPMQRARDTAAAIGSALPTAAYTVVDDLHECTPPTRRREIMKDGKPESFTACKAQLDRVFEAYFRPAAGAERSELFVCHGNVIRYLVTRALGVDSEAWLEMSVGHASVTRIRVEPDGRFKVLGVGEVGHLPATLRTGASGDPERSLAVPALRTAPAAAAPKPAPASGS